MNNDTFICILRHAVHRIVPVLPKLLLPTTGPNTRRVLSSQPVFKESVPFLLRWLWGCWSWRRGRGRSSYWRHGVGLDFLRCVLGGVVDETRVERHWIGLYKSEGVLKGKGVGKRSRIEGRVHGAQQVWRVREWPGIVRGVWGILELFSVVLVESELSPHFVD